MHPTPCSKPTYANSIDLGAEVTPSPAVTSQPSPALQRVEISLPVDAGEEHVAFAPAEYGVVPASSHHENPHRGTGVDRICLLLAEGYLAQKVAESRVHEFPEAARRETSRPVQRHPSHSIDQLIAEEVGRRGAATPRYLGSLLRVTRTPLQKALRRLETAGVLVGAGKTRNRVYRAVKSAENAAA